MSSAGNAVTGKRRRRRGVVLVLAVCVPLLWMPVIVAPPDGAAAAAESAAAGRAPAVTTPPGPDAELAGRGWVWPAVPFRLVRPFVAPAHAYGPGHRGIDLDLLGGTALRAPAGGVIAFSGAVAGRGVLTIDHGDGLVTTFEPVSSALEPGEAVAGGEEVAVLAAGGHAAEGTVHLGVRLDGAYINPLLLLGGVPRAVLLPCC